MHNVELGGTAASSPEAGLPCSPKPSIYHELTHVSHASTVTLHPIFLTKLQQNSHCGLTVRRAFSFFFIVLTAFDMAGQKSPGSKTIFLHEILTLES